MPRPVILEAGGNANKVNTGRQGNRGNMGGNQAKMHTGQVIVSGGWW
jgi:hypothetical protein